MRGPWAAALLCAALAVADDTITVVRKTLELEQEHVLPVHASLEYMLRFVPSPEQSQFPMRVWMSSDAGDVSHPLLLTARQRTGAITWQLPYQLEGGALLQELQRTLCADACAADAAPSDCGAAEARAGEFSVHVSSWGGAPVTLRLRAAPASDAALHMDAVNHIQASPSRPHVSYYRFPEGQAAARLVVASADDTCATVAVAPARCPVPQTLREVEASALRMTVQRSGAVQLSRANFPNGFYVIVLVLESDEACTGEEEAQEQDWLWEAAVGRAEGGTSAAPRARLKNLSLEIKATLSRAQYLVGFGATLGFFLAFYVGFGVLVLAQRWPRWRRLVAPRAVLAQGAEAGAAGVEQGAVAERGAADARPRRASTATFDSSDNSDTESEGESASPSAPPAPAPAAQVEAEAGAAAEAEAAGARPFGLPARLRVAALARRRDRVLAARSQRYLYALGTVAVFYALPVVQFVIAFQVVLNVSGSLDLCYYNWLCAHPAGALSDFNHVASNAGYLALGALFALQVRRRRARRARRPRDPRYGIPQHYGLLASLGAGMVVVAMLSASYHVCPNRLNFQFDTAFMYVLAVLSMVKIYQARHPDINARAHATFGVLAVLIALVVWGVLGGGPLFWSVFTVLHVFTFLLLSLRIYYVGQFRLEKRSLAEAARALRGSRPLYGLRLAALVAANAVNWAFALYGLAVQPADIASHLLFVLLCNALLHMCFYLGMKLAAGERLRWYAWAWLGGAALAWAAALWQFTTGSSDWAGTPAASRLANHECRVLQFYDSHDLWHMLSAVALFATFNSMLTWDDGLSAVPRTEITVF